MRIEDYALIGDRQSAALVGKDGSIDWLCLPRFDSDACFAALLGRPEHGRWSLAPQARVERTRRRYRDNTLILETELECADGAVRLVDFMPPRDDVPNLVRIVEGVRGRVPVVSELVIRFGFGETLPWIQPREGAWWAIAGPDALCLHAGVAHALEQDTLRARFEVAQGQKVPFALTWHASHTPVPPALDPDAALSASEDFWTEWVGAGTVTGPWAEAVTRSLITLKALTYAPTGAVIAAPTASLPERIGGVRNWDYRFGWLRDATFTLCSMMFAGYNEEARAWRDWLMRAVAGHPRQMQIMYGPAGERRLAERELPWLPGYEGSRPVRAGNAAVDQFQLDVFGEVLDAFLIAERGGMATDENVWGFQRRLVEYLEGCWREPDEGIWEVRGPRRHFTHSKVMAWVAFDRAIAAVETLRRVEGPVERWRAIRAEIHDEVCRQGFDRGRNAFVQSYGSQHLDASLLMIPLVGFLPATDPRVLGTVGAIERELLHDGFVRRYHSDPEVDGLPSGEGAFLPCTFWLAMNQSLCGRGDDARRLFERLLELRNDVGLLAEEYDPIQRRLLGNFPQAFSHVSLINTALQLEGKPAIRERAQAGR
jgi:GH15 family glucan-1,4-alpha-glucosidase